MVKVVVNNGQYKITIPKDIALAKGWDSDTNLLIIMNEEGNIVLQEIMGKRGKDGKK